MSPLGSNPGQRAKAYAAALVSIGLFVGHGVATGDWTDTESLTAALTVLLVPFIVWLIPNDAP